MPKWVKWNKAFLILFKPKLFRFWFVDLCMHQVDKSVLLYVSRLPSLWLWFNDILCALSCGVYMWHVWRMLCGRTLNPLRYENTLQKPLSNSIKWIHYHEQSCDRNQRKNIEQKKMPVLVFGSFAIMINGRTLANVQCLFGSEFFSSLFSLCE